MIICLTSLARAGKDTFADYLVDKYNFTKLNLSDVLRDELKAQGKQGTKEEMSLLGDEWRKLYGMDVVMRRTLDKAKQYDKVIITGVRSIEEYYFIKNNADEVYLIAVTADKEIRFDRRNQLDPQIKEEFFARDERDIKNKGLDKVIKAADFEVSNNYSSRDDFYKSIDDLMQKMRIN
ncbi:MAG: AAA family ATPase [Nanoarchaeota archaeon]|nr:AAA family ATPase [Nanoarchaeota archaeon]MBU4242368.1 AAA family ATPase [Nanoarchaeota archaeon]MBU4352156.1 AAA family ATPase [Nanoarchaeota archaeon]MBU4455918.1 AAA family ATPase [Nanoarchaeota archaeon]MCG2719820.1 AAA family ATPase [Nanoarchaeota archaeon]